MELIFRDIARRFMRLTPGPINLAAGKEPPRIGEGVNKMVLIAALFPNNGLFTPGRMIKAARTKIFVSQRKKCRIMETNNTCTCFPRQYS